MDLEFHQLDLRYETLRTRSPGRERRLLASLADLGQQMPIVVVAGEDSRQIVIDGYKRVRALRRLGRDLVGATRWELSEAEALLLERHLRTTEGDSPIEQGWFLRELQSRFGLSSDELERRFDRSKSWVSRRLALVGELPAAIQEHVRQGAIGPHAAMKYLVPLARANRDDCLRLAEAIAPLGVTSRQLGELYGTYVAGTAKTRELVLTDPQLVLRAQEEARRAGAKERGAAQLLAADFEILGSVARRANARLRQHVQTLLASERDELHRCALAAWTDLAALWRRLEKEVVDARSEAARGDPGAA